MNISPINLQKLLFISNALDDGWIVKKNGDIYIFSKNKNGIKEVYSEQFLPNFITKYSMHL